MTSKDNEDTAEGNTPTEAVEELGRRLDELEEAIIAERDDAGVPGRVSERDNVQQVEPDHQAPS